MSDALAPGTYFLVLAMRTPAFDPAVGPRHRVFLDALAAERRLAATGGFSDGSGGAYLLRAADLDEATAIAHRDPLHLEGASVLSVREWVVR
ncbi:YciI family protein [Coralloluteibacterium thermophilus]|uniref:YciI family protein n=1 Tax=Coralloluteibacterium thermophilum TaxID=2707049 RepID=A0ABV9NJD5_9GAMM